MATSALPSSASNFASSRRSPTLNAIGSAPAWPFRARRTLPRLPSMPSLACVAEAAPSMVNRACSLAGAIIGAPRASNCAVSGANRASTAMTGVISGASRSRRMLPRGDDVALTMRPLAEKAAPPRSTIASRSI